MQYLVSTNQKQLIISAIFRELYRHANVDTIDGMLQRANLLLSQSTTINPPSDVAIEINAKSNSTLNLINNIPDAILSRIETYLQPKELFFNRFHTN